MKRDNKFSKLYFESLRQTRVIGIIFAIILTVSSLFILINGYIKSLSYIENMRFEDPEFIYSPEIISFTEFNPLYITLPFIMSPILALTAFSFLNKRNSSDFYHSITQKRSTLFISYASASFTWLVFAAIVSTTVGIVTALCFNNIFVINWSTLIYLLEALVASFYVFAAATLATTATGTLLNNICLTGIIIAVPRVLMYLIAESVLNAVNVLPGISHLGILDPRYNLIFKYLISLNYSISSEYSVTPIVYTLILAIIYIVIAFIAFIKRPSEAAGQSAPNRFLQATYRIAFVMLICSPACFLITLSFSDFYSGNIISIIAIYVFALIAWFVYELITTKKASNLLKTIPSLSILVLLNVIMIVTSIGIKYNVESFRPEPKEIEYIKFADTEYDFYGYDYMSLYQYIVGDQRDIEIKDPTAIKLVSDSLKMTLDGDGAYYWNGNPHTTVSEDGWQVTYTNITVGIKTSTGIKYRSIDISDTDAERLRSALFDTIVNERKLNSLPDPKDVVFETYTDINQAEALEIYRTLCNEFAGMNKKQILEASADNTRIGSITIQTTYGLNVVSVDIPITLKLKETSAKLIEIMNEETLIKEVLINGMPSQETALDSSVNIEIYDRGQLAYSWYGSMTELEVSGMADILRKNIDEKVDMDGAVANFNLHYFEYDSSKDRSYDSSRYISLGDIEIKDLPEYFLEYASKYID